MLDKLFVTMFRLHGTARSSTNVFIDLLLVCYLANTTCAIINIMTTLIFIILIVSRLHAFSLVVPIRSFLHVLVEIAVISYFQHSMLNNSSGKKTAPTPYAHRVCLDRNDIQDSEWIHARSTNVLLSLS